MKRKYNVANARIFTKYGFWLKEGKGLAERTVNTKLDDIANFDHFLGGKDFREMNEKIATAYREHLKAKKWNGRPILLKTVNQKLGSVVEFYKWLKKQPGYRVRVKESALVYFELSIAEKTIMMTQKNLKEFPKLVQVIDLINSINGDSEVDMRDRALIAFIPMTGMRVKSITTLRMEDFDSKRLMVTLNPANGASTKFSIAMKVFILVLDDKLLEHFLWWIDYLSKVRKFGPQDPIFPQTDLKLFPGTNSFYGKDVKPHFWKNTGAINKIFRDRADAAALPYFNPHSFRTAHYQIIRSMNPTLEELSAVSQNMGHSDLRVSELSYGMKSPNELEEVLSNMRLNNSRTNRSNDRMGKIQSQLDVVIREMSKLSREKDDKDK